MNIVCGPYLQNVSKNSITIMWHTSNPATSVVEYEAAEQIGWNYVAGKPQPTYPERSEQKRLTKIHAVTLDGLKEGWEYYYRVSSASPDGVVANGSELSFRTAISEDQPFSFATYGDSHYEHIRHKQISQLVRGGRPDIFVGTGDIVKDTIECYRERFFECTKEIAQFSPWYAAMGNHDSPNDGYYKYFSYPQPHHWYSFNYGCAHFVVLNSNLDYRPGSEQWVWLQQDLEKFQDARWKFIFFHHPPYCSNHCEIVKTRTLCELFEQYHVDIVYNAHATIYERFHPLTNGRYDSVNGVVYFVCGGAGYDTSRSPGWIWDRVHPLSATVKSISHFLMTHVAPDSCTVRATDYKGRMFDMLTLTKNAKKMTPLPPANISSPPPESPEPGTVVAGLAEENVGWVLPRPQYSLDEKMAHSGGNSIRWSNDGCEAVVPAIRRVLFDNGCPLEAVADRRYTISAWIKTQDVEGGATISFEYSGDMGFIDRIESEPLAGTDDWSQIIIETPPLPPNIYWCRVVLSARPGSTGTAWFDDLIINEIEEQK